MDNSFAGVKKSLPNAVDATNSQLGKVQGNEGSGDGLTGVCNSPTSTPLSSMSKGALLSLRGKYKFELHSDL